MKPEADRTRLIGEIATLLHGDAVPEEARAAGLTLIGWLARRMPGEGPHTSCCKVMIERAAETRNGSPRSRRSR